MKIILYDKNDRPYAIVNEAGDVLWSGCLKNCPDKLSYLSKWLLHKEGYCDLDRYKIYEVSYKVCQLSETPNQWFDGWIIFDRETGKTITGDTTNDEIAYLTWVTPIYAFKEEAQYAIECIYKGV